MNARRGAAPAHRPARPVFFAASGGGGGEPVVLLPGLFADHRAWGLVQRHLAPGLRTIAVDNRGHGRSHFTGEALSIESMAQDVIALMDDLAIPAFFVAGHSMGGAIAQVLAHRHPGRVRGIVLCNTFRHGAGARLAALAADLGAQPGPLCPERWSRVSGALRSKAFSGPLLARLHEDLGQSAPPPDGGVGLARQVEAIQAFDSRTWVHEVAVPALVMHSRDDEAHFGTEAEALAGAIAGARRGLLHGGHASLLESWRGVGEAIRGFVSAHASARGAPC